MAHKEDARSASATRNQFRYAPALWRLMRSNLDDDINSDLAIVKVGFARVRFGGRLKRARIFQPIRVARQGSDSEYLPRLLE